MRRVLVAAAVTTALAALLSGCAGDAALTASKRLTMNRPTELQRVLLPVVVSWKAKDVKATTNMHGPGPFFAVFVDRPPVAAGSGLDTLVESDCRAKTDCTQRWFADHHVYVTGAKSITLTSVPATSNGVRTGADHSHTVTVVLVHQNGVRVDESAATVEFSVAGA